jgi:hypothetical protein
MTSEERKQAAKEVSVESLLEKIGHKPRKDSSSRSFYSSPLHAEDDPSFVLYKGNNSWYDWGLGVGGDSIQFVMMYEECSFIDAISKILDNEGSLRKHKPSDNKLIPERGIDILDVGDFTNECLITYAKLRGVGIEVLSAHCRQIDYTFKTWDHVINTGIGFRNDKYGWEIRSPKFKGGNHPKTWTNIKGGGIDNECDLFEGFFDFLSFLEYNDLVNPVNDTIIINSLSFCPMVKDVVDKYDNVNIYLDNDGPADMKIQDFFTGDKYTDKRHVFEGHEDYNDFVISTLK